MKRLMRGVCRGSCGIGVGVEEGSVGTWGSGELLLPEHAMAAASGGVYSRAK